MNYFEQAMLKLATEIPFDHRFNGDPRLLYSFYALLVFVKGDKTTIEDVHDAWSAWCNLTDPGHKSIIPFDELDRIIQEHDREFLEGIHRVSELINA